jgi:hypothetical protein
MPEDLTTSSCRNCRRPVHWLEGIGWLHGELPQYAHLPMTCEIAHPVEHGPRCMCDKPLTAEEASRR